MFKRKTDSHWIDHFLGCTEPELELGAARTVTFCLETEPPECFTLNWPWSGNKRYFQRLKLELEHPIFPSSASPFAIKDVESTEF